MGPLEYPLVGGGNRQLVEPRAGDQHAVESRVSDVPGLRLPTWAEVMAREYDAWDRRRAVIDTASSGVSESVATCAD